MSLYCQFMSREVISLPMSHGCGGVGVRGKVMEFCDPIVRALWHSVLLGKQQSTAPISSHAAATTDLWCQPRTSEAAEKRLLLKGTGFNPYVSD